MIKTRTNKTRTMRSVIVICMFLLHAFASAGWAGELISWGSDSYELVSNTPAGNDFVAVSACGLHSVALKSDGSLVAWGADGSGQVSDTPTGKDFTAVAAGGNHNVALKTDGSLVAWGSDNSDKVSGTPAGNDFVDVAAGKNHSVALKSDGSLVSWGNDGYYLVQNTPSSNDFVAVSAGYWHSIALKSDGSLVAWGYDGSGQISKTPAGNDFMAISAGGAHNLALKSDGSLVAWGYDVFGQVSDTLAGNDFVAVAAGEVHSIALKSDGSLVAWGKDDYEQVSNPPAGKDFITVSGGNIHSVAIRETETTTKPTVSITSADASAAEPSNNGSFMVSRTGDTSGNLLVYYSTSGSTASSGADYAALPGYVDIQSGQSSAYIAVDVVDDSTVEDSEIVRLTISSNSAYDIGSLSNATVTITDDDSEPPADETIVTITAPDASASEPVNDGYFRISRTGDTSKKLRVYYITSGSTASAGTDYESLPGYVYIPSGQSSVNVSVDVIDDTTVESLETVKLTVRSISSYTKYVVGSPSYATVTITDDDDTPVDKSVVTISAPDYSAGEPANDGYFRISRTGDTSSSLRVYYSTSDSTASAGYDYAALTGYVDISAGQTFAYVDVVVINDSTVESSETVQLTLSSNAAYTIGSPSYAIVTIADDDEVPPPPPADVEELMADTLTFFYASIDDGSLVGVGVYNLYRMRWILESAYDQIVAGDYEGACVELTNAYLRCDGEDDIPDYVSGNATATLAAMIQEIINELGC